MYKLYFPWLLKISILKTISLHPNIVLVPAQPVTTLGLLCSILNVSVLQSCNVSMLV